MRGVAEVVDLSKTGKSYRVKVGTDWFGAKKDTGIEQMKGKTIEFDVTRDAKFGDWMENIKVVNGSAPAPANGPTTASGDRFYMPFVSNICAHSIQAGYCDTPEKLNAWAKAAYDVAQALDAL